MTTIHALFALDADADAREILERFVSETLAEAGVWTSARTSDGISWFRFVERGPARLRVCGRIWEITQNKPAFWGKQAFWIDAERTSGGSSWTLHFGLDTTSLSERRARTLLDLIDRSEDAAWRVTLTGGR